MAGDLRPLIRARKRLSASALVPEQVAIYAPRDDGLGDKLDRRILDVGLNLLLVAGATGCGKTTELRRLRKRAAATRLTVFCPYDETVGVTPEPTVFFSFLLWKLYHALLDARCPTTPESQREFLGLFPNFDRGPNFQGSRGSAQKIQEVLTRLQSESGFASQPTFLIDGLEKLPASVSSTFLIDVLRAPAFQAIQAVAVVPNRLRFGPDAITRHPGLERPLDILPVPVVNARFAHQALSMRIDAELVDHPDTMERLADASGGIVRDAIQLAADACQIALDGNSPELSRGAAEEAIRQMAHNLRLAISDTPERATKFLHAVRDSGQLPGDSEMRDLALALNLIIEGQDGTFRVHPLLKDL